MAKDDYFVIAYRILSYLYACFKAGELPDLDMFGDDALRINTGYWVNVMESLNNEGYVTGAAYIAPLAVALNAKYIDVKITQKGIEFLQDSPKMAEARDFVRAKEFLRTVKDTIPGL